MTSEMIERVAAAIETVCTCRTCGVFCPDGCPPADCDGRCSLESPTREHQARAAIEEMLVPTKAMLAVADAMGDYGREPWPAMIDVALGGSGDV